MESFRCQPSNSQPLAADEADRSPFSMFPCKCSCPAHGWNTPQGLPAPFLSDRTGDRPQNHQEPVQSLWVPLGWQAPGSNPGMPGWGSPTSPCYWQRENGRQVGYFLLFACSCISCLAPWWYPSGKSSWARPSFWYLQSCSPRWQFRLSRKLGKLIYHWNILLKQNITKSLVGKLV